MGYNEALGLTHLVDTDVQCELHKTKHILLKFICFVSKEVPQINMKTFHLYLPRSILTLQSDWIMEGFWIGVFFFFYWRNINIISTFENRLRLFLSGLMHVQTVEWYCLGFLLGNTGLTSTMQQNYIPDEGKALTSNPLCKETKAAEKHFKINRATRGSLFQNFSKASVTSQQLYL